MLRGDVPAASMDQSPIRQILRRAEQAWASKDPRAIAALFTENTKIVMGSVYLRSRDELLSYLASDHAGPLSAAQVRSEPVHVASADGAAALVVTDGAMLLPDGVATTPGPTSATWLLTRQGGEWLISAYHYRPMRAAEHLPLPRSW